jgi:hypothetical protein
VNWVSHYVRTTRPGLCPCAGHSLLCRAAQAAHRIHDAGRAHAWSHTSGRAVVVTGWQVLMRARVERQLCQAVRQRR